MCAFLQILREIKTIENKLQSFRADIQLKPIVEARLRTYWRSNQQNVGWNVRNLLKHRITQFIKQLKVLKLKKRIIPKYEAKVKVLRRTLENRINNNNNKKEKVLLYLRKNILKKIIQVKEFKIRLEEERYNKLKRIADRIADQNERYNMMMKATAQVERMLGKLYCKHGGLHAKVFTDRRFSEHNTCPTCRKVFK